ncbi:uncharacterized protein LOC117104614 isoform X2 [Anneissia japonica]|uniref:uncharacterized protein LOC117104614 isoform X2 n=1 Tax=Anneissia japonica TaxID=1529436 RepID=UPI0014256F4C|nr:uncharacterized protein LOC117104614 isoform X2 [Anneissia japonica]
MSNSQGNNKKQEKFKNERAKSKKLSVNFCCFMPTDMMSSEEASTSGESADSLQKKPDVKAKIPEKGDLSTSMDRGKEHYSYKSSYVDLDNAKTVNSKEKRKRKKKSTNTKKKSNQDTSETSEDSLYQENEYQQGEGGPESMSYEVNDLLNASELKFERAATPPGFCNEFQKGYSNISGERFGTSTENESCEIVPKDKMLNVKHTNSKVIKTDNISEVCEKIAAQTVTQSKNFDGNSREKDIPVCKRIEKPLETEVPISEDEEDLYSANTDVLQGVTGSDEQYDSIGQQRLKSVGSQHDVIHYAKKEWKSKTEKAQNMRQGYEQVFNNGYRFLRRIRGDNYCAIRATLYQALVKGLPILEKWKNTEKITEELCELEWMQHWSFGGGRLGQVNTLQKVRKMLNHCLTTLQTEVPTFVWLIFARDTSPNPRTLMLNHLNNVGSQGGLEQVEMCLLGNTLEISIKVMRPLQHSQQDFISMYPDVCKTCPSVTLIAEDDRHYNIVYN